MTGFLPTSTAPRFELPGTIPTSKQPAPEWAEVANQDGAFRDFFNLLEVFPFCEFGTGGGGFA